MIPASSLFDQSTIAALLDHDPIVQDYRAFFSLLDWSVVERWQVQRSSRGRPPTHPESAYIKAFLVRLREGFLYATQFRQYLLKHPLLVIELVFHLVLDYSAAYGFDVEHTLPCRYWFNEKLRTLDRSLLQDLLHATVAALQAEIPGLGETVAAAITPDYGDVVLAEYTQPFNEAICERINSQAKELGIERPRVHNRRSVANLNTLIYVIMNVRALQRAKSINRGLLLTK
jgi:hypothetical protein